MNFIITKISNHGVSHPFVARLSVQTSELIKWADLSKEDKQALVHFLEALNGEGWEHMDEPDQLPQ